MDNFPQDSTNADGRPFWSYPKRSPVALAFDASDRDHLAFVTLVAKLWAGVIGIEVGVIVCE